MRLVTEAIVPLDIGEDTQHLKILILDDVETDRLRLRRYCRKAGLEFTLYEASDLPGFRSALDSASFDLIFLDYHLEIDTGLDALKLLVGHENQIDAIPIMVTSVNRIDLAVEAMRNGCADYVVKEELSVETIRKTIVSAFERRVLVTALRDAESARAAMRASISRLSMACGHEIRAILASTLRHSRTLRAKAGDDMETRRTLEALETSCNGLASFIAEISAILEDHQPSLRQAKP